MSQDAIVDEVRAAREAYAARFDFDLDAIHRDIKSRERSSADRLVRLPAKRLPPQPLRPSPDDGDAVPR